jgi:hypothetical protein
LKEEISMSKKLCLVPSILFMVTMLLAACAPAAAPTTAPTTPVQPTTAPDTTAVSTAAPVQPTTVPATTSAPVQPTTTPGEISKSGDLCGGTGGNGQIVSVGNNEFTMKRNDNGSHQIVRLSGGATIKTSAGSASLSDLKTGDHVTLVGGPNPDGSFTADVVVVCN